MELFFDAIGCLCGLLLVVNVFRVLAGVSFTHGRQIAVAYVAALWLAIASSLAQGFDIWAVYVTAFPLAVALEVWALRQRSAPDARAPQSSA